MMIATFSAKQINANKCIDTIFKKAIKINDVHELGDVMINQITNLFSENTNKKLN